MTPIVDECVCMLALVHVVLVTLLRLSLAPPDAPRTFRGHGLHAQIHYAYALSAPSSRRSLLLPRSPWTLPPPFPTLIL